MKYVLVEVIEREISTPEFFKTFEDAHATMAARFHEAAKADCVADEELDGELNEWDAWCENSNHDNCDWKIFEI